MDSMTFSRCNVTSNSLQQQPTRTCLKRWCCGCSQHLLGLQSTDTCKGKQTLQVNANTAAMTSFHKK